MGDGDETKGDDVATVVSVLDDSLARSILVRTANRALSADELVEGSESSRTTVYRRIRRLVELDLLTESQELDPDGHHFNTYRARLDRVTIDLGTNGFDIDVDRQVVEDDAVDRLNRLYERLQQ
ncbi:ArsR family transcriptional regulator [Halorussus amylolyticus]|uniref:ArsR family transcriptional regulator n=1 Tax=Halorussus amylolyticus TaxID=1126242 RepID=UPI00104CEA0F|nr:ArsR family transcriptional regulator [Halorussus amylolyticus]